MKYIGFAIVLFVVLSCAESRNKKYYYYEGPIQGTSFHITYEWDKDLTVQIDSLLNNFNKSLSNYDPESTISKINYNKSDVIDELFVTMFESSMKIYEKSDGAFDISLAPIINLWGFGWLKRTENIIPDSTQISELMKFVGMDKISIVDGKIVKEFPETMIISNAIAQGLSVDYVADYFFKLGLKNFLVEIGGELYCFGLNDRGENWRIGVDKPIDGSSYDNRENQIIISLSGKSIATSGNYRKFIENENQKYGHSFNPKTGFPANNEMLSVSVVTESCMDSDAWATAFMVCGIEKSQEILKSLSEVDAYFIYLDQNGDTKTFMTDGFSMFIEK